MEITAKEIKESIYKDFATTYKGAAPFINYNPLWDFCMGVVSDPIKLYCIIFANDLEIPPVKSLLLFYKLEFSPADDFQFTNQESQWLGSLMGFIFKVVLDYKSQKERIRVNTYGVGTATRFFDSPNKIIIN